MAWRTFKMEPGRVVLPGLVIFGLDAIVSTFFTEEAVHHLGLVSLGATFVGGVSSLGLIFYSGMLERLIGSVERNEPAQPIPDVIRTLPWARLALAEVVLVAIGFVMGLLFVLPGMIADTLFALVGPLINLLDAPVPDAFRRSFQLVLPHFFLVFTVITIPLVVEHEVVVLVADLIPHEQVWLIYLSSFVIGDLMGMALGLLEVTVAERLVLGARGPGKDPRRQRGDLLDPGVTL
jgi:hypothetical protein